MGCRPRGPLGKPFRDPLFRDHVALRRKGTKTLFFCRMAILGTGV